MKWRDISTAPRDATEVLICKATNADGKPIDKETFGLFVHRAAWWADEEGNYGEWVVYNNFNDDAPFFEPTHWMPIPPPAGANFAEDSNLAGDSGEVR